jgi:hypothetical protein
MRLLEMRGGYLYEHRPDLIPQGFLTDEEVALWAVYHDRRGKESNPAGGQRG